MTDVPPRRPAWLQWFAVALAAAALIYALSPILTPFLLGAVLAYICTPLVDRCSNGRLPRAVAAVVALALCIGAAITVLLLIVPLFRNEGARIIARLPDLASAFNTSVAPVLQQRLGITLQFDQTTLQEFASEHWDVVQNLLRHVYESMRIGGGAVVGVVVNLLLAPVVAFYLILDWHRFTGWLLSLVPPRWLDTATRWTQDVDALLGAFLRGQLLVMLVLAAYYCLALSIAGLPSALPIGLLTGLLIFIPYIGFASGLLLALAVAGLQFQGWTPVIAVLAIYGAGQIIESFLLTPYLVGERIGLSPLAVIFALMAFGQVFGFFGVLIALPAAAIAAVGLRELHRAYTGSPFFQGRA
jgi:predicted PurR-regulated permease PerM